MTESTALAPIPYFLTEQGHFPQSHSLNAEFLADIFVRHIESGSPSALIATEIISYLPEGEQNSQNLHEMENFVDWVLSRLDAKPPSVASSLEKTYQKWDATPYDYGGNSKKGIDCSHFVQRVYHDLGIDLPFMSAKVGKWDQVGFERVADTEKPRVGDLIMFQHPDGSRHVGVVVDPENKIFMGSQSTPGVDKSSYAEGSYWGKRVLEFWRYP